MQNKKEAYLCLSAMLNARLVRMLTREQEERMLEAASFEEAARVLTDCGYRDMSGMNAGEVESALAAHRAAIFDEMEKLAPDKAAVDVFRAKYDYHNAKVILKAEATGQEPERLLNASGSVAPEKLLNAWREERLPDLPEKLAAAMKEAGEILAHTANPRLSDAVLDRACFAQMLETAGQTGEPFLSGYVKLLIDSANLRSAVRTARLELNRDLLAAALIPGGDIAMEALVEADDGEKLAALFAHTPLEAAAELGSEAMSGGPLTGLERSIDDAVCAYLRQAKRVTYGVEVLTGYLSAVENEVSAARMILTGRLAGVAPAVIRERLRELYV